MTTPPHPAAWSRPHQLLTEAAELLDRILTTRVSDHLTAASDDLNDLLRPCGHCRPPHASVLEHAWEDTLSDQPGQPGSGLGGISVAGGSSDPTASAVTDSRKGRPLDSGAYDRARLTRLAILVGSAIEVAVLDSDHKLAGRIRKNAAELHVICRNRMPRPALPSEQARSADGEPGCESCWTIGLWSPPYRVPWREPKPANTTGTGGAFQWHDPGEADEPDTTTLCRPCYERAVATGHPPTKADVEHKRDHPRGRWPARRIDPKSA